MDCPNTGLGDQSPSTLLVPVDKTGNQELSHDGLLQCTDPVLKDDNIKDEGWGCPHIPLRPPFTMLRPGTSIPEIRRPLRQRFSLTPAVKEEGLAMPAVNISEGLGGQAQKGHNSINTSQEVSGNLRLPEMESGPKVNSRPAERVCNNANPYGAFPGGQGFLSPRGPQPRHPAYVPSLRSGIMMDVTSRNARMANSGNLATVSFPMGAPRHVMENWQRLPFHVAMPNQCLPCSGDRGFIPSQHPRFCAFPNMPMAFPCPLAFAHPLLPFFFFYNFGAIRFPPNLN